MAPRAPRAAQRTAAALLFAAAIGLGGCEQLKAIGAMVGLGDDAPQTAPSPPPPRPRPATAAASPAPGRAGRAAPAPAVTAASPATAAPANQLPKPDTPGRAQAAGAAASPAPAVAAGQPPRPGTPGVQVATAPAPVPVAAAGQPAKLGATVTAQPTPAEAASASPAPAMPVGGQPTRPGAVVSSSPTGPQPATSPQMTGLPVQGEPFDPTGKRDPFRPYVTSAELAERRSKERLSPLQQLELSQLRLVAIVWGMRRNHAMVEDPAGVGYVLRVGTKVGSNGGRVARIAPDAVYVEESFRDASGAVLTNQITLRLPEKNRGGKGS